VVVLAYEGEQRNVHAQMFRNLPSDAPLNLWKLFVNAAVSAAQGLLKEYNLSEGVEETPDAPSGQRQNNI